MIKKSKNYIDIPVDAFSIGMNENSARLFLGIEDIPGNAESVEFSCGAYMTHRSLKTLAIALTDLVEKFEAALGEIPLDPVKVEQIKASIQVGKVDTTPPAA